MKYRRLLKYGALLLVLLLALNCKRDKALDYYLVSPLNIVNNIDSFIMSSDYDTVYIHTKMPLLKLAIAELHMKNFEPAEKYIRQSIGLGNVKAFEYLTLSVILSQKQEFQASYEAILNAHSLMPYDLFIVEMKAFIEYYSGKFANCKKSLRTIEKSYGNTAKTKLLRYRICMEQEKYRTALRYLENMTKDDPHFYDEFYSAGNNLMYMTKYKQALPFLEKAVELEPENSTYILRRGTAYYYTGKLKKARIDWNNSLKMGNKKADEYLKTYFE